jgi:hypothetical protein
MFIVTLFHEERKSLHITTVKKSSRNRLTSFDHLFLSVMRLLLIIFRSLKRIVKYACLRFVCKTGLEYPIHILKENMKARSSYTNKTQNKPSRRMVYNGDHGSSTSNIKIRTRNKAKKDSFQKASPSFLG